MNDGLMWLNYPKVRAYNYKERENIKQCTCTSEYQDNQYGKSMRVHNLVVTNTDSREYRCTVCNNVKKE